MTWTKEGIELIMGAIFILGFGFMMGLALNKQAEKDHWRCSFMPWKCPYMGAWFITHIGIVLMLLLVVYVCGQEGLKLL